jgi:hypothetical protein
MPNSVYDYFIYRLGNATKSEAVEKVFSTDDKEEYEKSSLYTHCGEASRHIIDAAFNMLVVCDPHPHVVDHILEAAKKAIDIIWYG